MLGIHFLQHWFNLSDLTVDEALYEAISMRGFMGRYLGHERLPDEAMVLTFATCCGAMSVQVHAACVRRVSPSSYLARHL